MISLHRGYTELGLIQVILINEPNGELKPTTTKW